MIDIEKVMNETSRKIADRNATEIQNWLESQWVTKENAHLYMICHSYKRKCWSKIVTHETIILKYCWEVFSQLDIKLSIKI